MTSLIRMIRIKLFRPNISIFPSPVPLNKYNNFSFYSDSNHRNNNLIIPPIQSHISFTFNSIRFISISLHISDISLISNISISNISISIIRVGIRRLVIRLIRSIGIRIRVIQMNAGKESNIRSNSTVQA